MRIRFKFLSIFLLTLGLHQCRVTQVLDSSRKADLNGLEGYVQQCSEIDTIKSVLISKADAVIDFQGDRYETKLTFYHIIDSVMFLAAVNSGYEVFRGRIDKDTITVIDRINKIVYYSALNKKFGYQHPVKFADLNRLTGRSGFCGDIEQGIDLDDQLILFDLSENYINRKIYLNRTSFKVEKFEFFHTKTGEYLTGERFTNRGIHIISDFIINAFELNASGGEIFYNVTLDIDMDVNRRKYSYIELQ